MGERLGEGFERYLLHKLLATTHSRSPKKIRTRTSYV